jgi:hypothetical protein
VLHGAVPVLLQWRQPTHLRLQQKQQQQRRSSERSDLVPWQGVTVQQQTRKQTQPLRPAICNSPLASHAFVMYCQAPDCHYCHYSAVS